MSDLLRIDNNYAKWLEEISINFKKSQIKASISVNTEMLKFYWLIGKGISENIQKSKHGDNFYKSLSLDLIEKIPNVKSFSPTNLHYMYWFYCLFSDLSNLPQVGVNLEVNEKIPQVGVKLDKSVNMSQVVTKNHTDENMVFTLPWGHIKVILDKYKNDKSKALFYIREAIQNNWSRAVLLNFIDTDLYERQGKAITNFDKSLPSIDTDLAKEITKDPYNFDFLNIRIKYDEKELKDALMDNIQRFLLELGSGFSFVGREYRLKVGETEQFIDMLFYNIKLKSYVVVEVKVRDFKPYELSKIFPKDFKSTMPTIEELEKELKE